MRLTWLGHACFLLEQDGYRVVTDPYTGVPGYPDLHVQAHEVFCSHGHGDHSAVQCVEILPRRESPFTVRSVEAAHDEKGGALRGKIQIRVFTAGGVSVAHLGDLGHQLSPDQIRQIGPLDAVLVPVGGYYTIDAQGAKAVCDALDAPCVIPMHYRHPPYGLKVVSGVEPFLALWPKEAVRHLDGPSLEVEKGTTGVIVPKFAG